jgi:hypothetical protein
MQVTRIIQQGAPGDVRQPCSHQDQRDLVIPGRKRLQMVARIVR